MRYKVIFFVLPSYRLLSSTSPFPNAKIPSTSINLILGKELINRNIFGCNRFFLVSFHIRFFMELILLIWTSGSLVLHVKTKVNMAFLVHILLKVALLCWVLYKVILLISFMWMILLHIALTKDMLLYTVLSPMCSTSNLILSWACSS